MSIKDTFDQQTAIIIFSSRCIGRVPVMSIQMSPSQPWFSLQDESHSWWVDSWHSNMKLDWKGARLLAWFTGPTLKLQGIFARGLNRPFWCNVTGCKTGTAAVRYKPPHAHAVKRCTRYLAIKSNFVYTSQIQNKRYPMTLNTQSGSWPHSLLLAINYSFSETRRPPMSQRSDSVYVCAFIDNETAFSAAGCSFLTGLCWSCLC